MVRSLSVRVVLVLIGIAIAYHWVGRATVAVGLLIFMLYELLVPPSRYRKFGPGRSMRGPRSPASQISFVHLIGCAGASLASAPARTGTRLFAISFEGRKGISAQHNLTAAVAWLATQAISHAPPSLSWGV